MISFRRWRKLGLAGRFSVGCVLLMIPVAQPSHASADEIQSNSEIGEIYVPGVSRSRDPSGNPKGLDALLRLPRGFVTTTPRSVAGATEAQWRKRFVLAGSKQSAAEAALVATKLELDGVAAGGSSSQWSVAPPGATGGNGADATVSPLSFRLRQKLRGDRERIDSTVRAMRELRIEADLAGVPDSWRHSTEISKVTSPN